MRLKTFLRAKGDCGAAEESSFLEAESRRLKLELAAGLNRVEK
jgi:hypothetical protein